MNKKNAPDSIKAEKNQDSTEKTKRPPSTAKLPWLVLLLSALLSLGALAAWLELSYLPKLNADILESHKIITATHLKDILNKQLNITQERLIQLGTDPTLISAVNENNEESLEKTSSILTAAFYKAKNLKIIPWNLSGTAGLDDSGLKPRNNSELMLLSKAGSNKDTQAVAYKEGNDWLVSYAAPVITDNKVIAVILLTFDKTYLTRLISNDSLNHSAKLTFKTKGINPQIITAYGDGSDLDTKTFDLDYTDGQINIAFNENELKQLALVPLPIYIGLGIVLLVLFIAIFVASRILLSLIKKDAIAIQNYAESQKSIHKTKAPTLNISELNIICDVIYTLGNMSAKTSINPSANNDYKNVDVKVTAAADIAAATVSESIQFDHPEIFKEYDIRGIADTQLTTDICLLLGKAIGTKAVSTGIKTLVMARDGRLSSERIQYDVSRGILSTGCNVIHIGQQPSPALYYATQKLGTASGVMITGSHNPAEVNGLKIVLNNKTLLGNDLQELLKLIESYSFTEGQGQISKQDISNDYIQDVSADIIIAKPLHVVIDAGNGVGGILSSQLLNMLDCSVTELYCDVDGNFPNHGPDPMVISNLTDLINKVVETNADIGIAFDGDADRMIAVTSSGKVVSSDEILMLFAKDVVSSNAGCCVVYDVKTSRNVQKTISDFGGRPIMTKSGHSNLKAAITDSGALLGGELTGHFYFNERWNGFDDGIYAAMRLIELLSTSTHTFDEELANLPTCFNTPELHIPITDGKQAVLILKKMADVLSTESCKILDIDGLRAEFTNGWGLIRKSNTSHTLSLRFEADTEEELNNIQAIFRNAINQLNLNLTIPF